MIRGVLDNGKVERIGWTLRLGLTSIGTKWDTDFKTSGLNHYKGAGLNYSTGVLQYKEIALLGDKHIPTNIATRFPRFCYFYYLNTIYNLSVKNT